MTTNEIFQKLPSIETVKSVSQSMAMLDAILMPEWEFRYYSYNAHWRKSQNVSGESMASMRDGEGGHYYILFNESGAIIKGFVRHTSLADYYATHGSPWPGVIDEIPHEFAYFVNEPAFDIQASTFCTWRQTSDAVWYMGDIKFPQSANVDGASHLLKGLIGGARFYKDWAESYYERDVSIDLVEYIYARKELTIDVACSLNPLIEVEMLQLDIKQIAYPIKNNDVK